MMRKGPQKNLKGLRMIPSEKELSLFGKEIHLN